MSNKKKKFKEENLVYASIRKPVAPPTRQFLSKKQKPVKHKGQSIDEQSKELV